MSIWLWIVSSIALPLVLAEFSEIAPWLALKVIRIGVHLIPDPIERVSRLVEWEAGLPEVPGKLTKLADAVSLVILVAPRSWFTNSFPLGRRSRLYKSAFAAFDYQIARVLTEVASNCHWGESVSYSSTSKSVYIHSYAFYAQWSWTITFDRPEVAEAFF